MIPNKKLSSQTFETDYLYPDNLPTDELSDYEYGGIDIQDPSEGLRYQTWLLQFVGKNFFLSSEDTLPYILFKSDDIAVYRGQTETPNVTEISLAFDQNMNPFVTYVADSKAGYWWFDSVQQKQVFYDMPDGNNGFPVVSPRCCIDDKRPLETSISDIILVYVRDNKCYFRAERDRYTKEYLLADNAYFRVLKIAMNRKGRLQMKVVSTQNV